MNEPLFTLQHGATGDRKRTFVEQMALLRRQQASAGTPERVSPAPPANAVPAA